MAVKDWPKVAIIVLNWNGWRDTIECLESFQQLKYPDFQIIVVDNGSTDDSTKQIKAAFPHLTVIETGCNLGYAGGNNVGIRYALEHGAKYILIVNNDTKLINPDFVQCLVAIMESDYSLGIIGPTVVTIGGKLQNTILFTPTLVNCLKESLKRKFRLGPIKNYDTPQLVEAVSGVCWLLRANMVSEVGLLDEEYFMYAEEQDFCYRAQKAGWKIMYYPVRSVFHTKEGNKERMVRQYIYTRRNLVLFLHKHFGFGQALILASFFLASHLLKMIVSRLRAREKDFYSFALLSRLLSELLVALSRRNNHV